MENVTYCEGVKDKTGSGVIVNYYSCCDGGEFPVGTVELVDNLEETETGKALDATMGKVLGDKIAEVDNGLSDLSNQLSGLSKKGVYSSNEVEIGTWIDGKPIYRKVFQGITPTQTTNGIALANLSNLNIDDIIHMYGRVKSSNGDYLNLVPHSYSYKGAVAAELPLWYSYTDKNLYYSLVGTDYASGSLYVIVEYTKN